MKYYKNLSGKKVNVVLSTNQSVFIGAGFVKLSEPIYKAVSKLYPNLLEEHKELNKEKVIKEPKNDKKVSLEKNDNLTEKKVIKEPVLKEDKKVITEPIEKKESVIKEEKKEEKKEEVDGKEKKKTKKTRKSTKKTRKSTKKNK